MNNIKMYTQVRIMTPNACFTRVLASICNYQRLVMHFEANAPDSRAILP